MNVNLFVHLHVVVSFAVITDSLQLIIKENELINKCIRDEILLLFPPPEKTCDNDDTAEQHQRLLAGMAHEKNSMIISIPYESLPLCLNSPILPSIFFP